ncbi:MAG: dihydroorotate dehydrogenase electron transfer subunit [Clostridiaceae bacterium]|nr:dihydroorotate dehydrogenase electron transfer subunit [Clostridiaceae bacterium]
MNFNELVQKSEMLAEDIYSLRIRSERIAQEALPGQFVNVRCSNGLDAYLRRPISICRVDPSNNTYDIVFMKKGKGTNYLCCFTEGDFIDVMGPLGNGFTLPEKNEKVAVVGGGIGIFPLLFLLEMCNASKKTAFLGFQTAESIVLKKDFEKACTELIISTDDGSLGFKGFITEPFIKWLKSEKPDRVYTCGPLPMMNIVAESCLSQGIFCQVSMEQRMGCGIGACLVCACKVKLNDDYDYAHVCKDGPVFPAQRLIFD